MVTIARNIIFKPTKIENYQSSNGRCRQSQDYIKFDGDFNGTRRVVSSITISSQDLSAYLNTDANPSTPYTPLYPGSPTTKQYVDQHDTVISATAPSSPTEGMVRYDSTNDVLKTYDGTNWSEAGTKMVVLEYGVSTWQDFLDAYNKNAIVYCKVPSGSSGYRMAFMAYTAGTTTPTEVEFQYYRSRSSHSTAANQLDEVYVYKLTNAGVWTTTQRDTAAKAIAGTGIGLTFNSSGMTISADTSVLATKTYVDEHDTVVSSTAPSNPTEGMVWYDTTNDVLKVYNGTTWDTIATGGAISDTAYGAGWDGQTTIAPSQNAVYDKISTMDTAISSNTTNINTINNKIPSEASSSNQLADKAYVGDSINSVTAYYITKSANGDQFATYAELASATTFYSGGVVRTPTKNDYTIVLDDENHDHATTRYIYNNGWEYQYTVNETPLTQAQLNALNSGITAAKVAKYDTLNTREFTLSGVGNSATVLAEAQEVFDWINAGNFAILKIATDSGQPTYLYKATTVDDVRFLSSDMVDGGYSDNFTTAMQKGVEIHYSGTTVTGVSYINNLTWQFLAINGQYQSAFMPTQDAHPATKKYVDSKSTIVSATAPSSPTEGMLWYDTTNDVLKTYNGTNWIEVGVESNTKTFYLTTGTSSSALQKAQECYNWYKSGKNPIVSYNGINYILAKIESTRLTFQSTNDSFSVSNNSTTLLRTDAIYLSLSGDSVTAVYTTLSNVGKLLATDVDYSTPYTPAYAGSPTTKKYVDDRDVYIGNSAPTSNLVEGRVRYDTTNDKLKVYDGTNWNECGGGYTAGPGIVIGTEHQDTQGPCPDGYHIGTVTEWGNIINTGVTIGAWTSSGGSDLSYYMKIPIAGFRFGSSGNTYGQGTYGRYWTCNSVLAGYAELAEIRSSSISYGNERPAADGLSIRPFRDVPVTLDTPEVVSFEQTYNGSGGAGVYEFTLAGGEAVISITDGTNWYTIANKNLGATTVYTSGATLSEANCGKYYQWGNNHGFEWTGTLSSTSSTQVDASSYGPGNYYSSSTFIIQEGGRDSSGNRNIRGGMSQGVWVGGDGNVIGNTGVLSVNNHTGAVTVNEVPSSGTTGNVLTKTANGYEWAASQGTTYNAGPGIEIGTIHNYSDMQGPAPYGFHVPSKDEWGTLCGILTTTFSMASNATTMGTYLKMPKAGFRYYGSANVTGMDYDGYYWSSTPYSANNAYELDFNSSRIRPQTNDSCANGFSIRCFKDSPVIPDNSWTIEYQPDRATGADVVGIYHNPTLGLISISGDGTTWYTIMDKNLGATAVFNQGDTLTDANCGYFYQWGNNYGFAHSGTLTTSSTKVDASNYGPGNYYSSSTFITGSSNWSSVQNDNLWGGVTGGITIPNAIYTVGGIRLAPNSKYNVKYHRYGPETDYANLSQYYTDNPKDTAYFTTDE